LHLLVDSTGLKIYGEGEWLGRKLQARTLSNQKTEAKIGCNVLNRMAGFGMPASARVH
jgi:hypothetical protein